MKLVPISSVECDFCRQTAVFIVRDATLERVWFLCSSLDCVAPFPEAHSRAAQARREGP